MTNEHWTRLNAKTEGDIKLACLADPDSPSPFENAEEEQAARALYALLLTYGKNHENLELYRELIEAAIKKDNEEQPR
jgi:hypothetical protein